MNMPISFILENFLWLLCIRTFSILLRLVGLRLDVLGLRYPVEVTPEIVLDLLFLPELVKVAARLRLLSLFGKFTARKRDKCMYGRVALWLEVRRARRVIGTFKGNETEIETWKGIFFICSCWSRSNEDDVNTSIRVGKHPAKRLSSDIHSHLSSFIKIERNPCH